MSSNLDDLIFQTAGTNAFDVIISIGSRELTALTLTPDATPKTLRDLILASANPEYVNYAKGELLKITGIDDPVLANSPIYFTRTSDFDPSDLTLQGHILEQGMELGSGKEWDVQVADDNSVTTHGTTQTWKKVVTALYGRDYFVHIYNTSTEDVDLGWFEASDTVAGSTEAIYQVETLPARSSIYIQMKPGYYLTSKATLLTQTLNKRLYKRVRL